MYNNAADLLQLFAVHATAACPTNKTEYVLAQVLHSVISHFYFTFPPKNLSPLLIRGSKRDRPEILTH